MPVCIPFQGVNNQTGWPTSSLTGCRVTRSTVLLFSTVRRPFFVIITVTCPGGGGGTSEGGSLGVTVHAMLRPFRPEGTATRNSIPAAIIAITLSLDNHDAPVYSPASWGRQAAARSSSVGDHAVLDDGFELEDGMASYTEGGGVLERTTAETEEGVCMMGANSRSMKVETESADTLYNTSTL